MIGLLRSEWIKLRSVWSTWVTLAAGLGLTLLVAALSASQAVDRGGPANLSALSGGVSASALVFAALGVQVIGQEHRWGTLGTTFAATPRRLRVLLAKLAVVSVMTASASAALVGLTWTIGAVSVPGFRLDAVDHRIAWTSVAFSVGMAVTGFGVGAIVRQPHAGVLVILGEVFVVERLLLGLLPASARWLPFANGFEMTLRLGGSTPLRPVLSGAEYFFLVAVALTAVGILLTVRRDA